MPDQGRVRSQAPGSYNVFANGAELKPVMRVFKRYPAVDCSPPPDMDVPEKTLKKYRQWVEEMKVAPRGPFKRIRWFCADGTVHPWVWSCASGVLTGQEEARTTSSTGAGSRSWSLSRVG